MPIDFPSDGVYGKVSQDLAPLEAAYPGGALFLPDGFEDIGDSPLSNGSTTAVPWEYHVPFAPRLRGMFDEDRAKTLVIRGVTIVHESKVEDEGGGDLFRRYVDWASVWAQQGFSSGRGEQADERTFIDPSGKPTDQ